MALVSRTAIPVLSLRGTLLLCAFLFAFPDSSRADSPSAAEPAALRTPICFIEDRGALHGTSPSFRLDGELRRLRFGDSSIRIALEDWWIGLDPVDARTVAPVGLDPLPGVVSVFKGPRSQWRSGLPTFERLRYAELWPGIDLVFRASADTVKYELHVRPGADPHRIRFRWSGVDRLDCDAEGELVASTPRGELRDERPIAWQWIDGDRVAVDVEYTVPEPDGDRAFVHGFRIGAYDPTVALVVDPAVFVHAGYIGGMDPDTGDALARGRDGSLYIVGDTQSREDTFPVVVGPDPGYNGGQRDAFVAKVSADGSTLLYCGYIGGTEDDTADGVVIDSEGRAIVVGATSSDETSFPVIGGPDLVYNGGVYDAFVARVGADGTALDLCGYIGGVETESAHDAAVDAADRIHVIGITESDETTFPAVVGPDLTHNGGNDAFVVRISESGSIQTSGFIGGSGTELALDIALDAEERAYVSGQTGSDPATFPLVVGPDLTYNGGFEDAFVARISADRTGLEYCGYIGGNGNDIARGMAVDSEGRAHVTGFTLSTQATFPVAVGPDLTFNGGFVDAYVARVAADGSGLEYCGYIGGDGFDNGLEVAVDVAGNLYVCGGTESSEGTFPVAHGPDETLGGARDGFVARVRPDGASLDFCGYIGGDSHNDGAYDLVVDDRGNAWLVGQTGSDESSFPVVGGPDPGYNGGTQDAWLARVAFQPCRVGSVDVGASGTAADVLFVNGSAGDATRRLRLATGAALEVTMAAPPAGPSSAPFALYAWLAEPDVTTRVALPRSIGALCFPSALSGGGAPMPDVIWNNAGREHRLGTATLPSTPAPSAIASVPNGSPRPITFTLQGLIADQGSGAEVSGSVTNAVVVEIGGSP